MGIREAAADIGTINALLTGAERSARELGDEVPGAEHLILAALAIDETATIALAEFGIDARAFRSAIVAVHHDALRAAGADAESGEASSIDGSPRGAFRSSPTAQRIFRRAVEFSKQSRPARLRGGHVILAATELSTGTAARTIAALGIDRVALADAARRSLAAT